MRIGGNQHKFKIHQSIQKARVTAAVVTFLPDELDYFKDRFNVIKLSLASLVRHADLPIDLMVFDNGSCRKLVNYLCELKEAGVIRFLILSSENVGLAGAYRIIAKTAPGEFIAFANDDVFYFPNWLSPHIHILDKLPDVGLVSGFYLRATDPRIAQIAAEKGLEVQVVTAPDEWLDEFCRDASYPSCEAYIRGQEWQGWTDIEDRLITSNGVSAYAGGVMWQAVFKKDTLQQLLPSGNPLMHGFRSYDGYFHSEIVRQGFLRLSTPNRIVRHIGNVVTPEMASLAAQFGIPVQATISLSQKHSKGHALMRVRLLRRLIVVLYNFLYRIIKS